MNYQPMSSLARALEQHPNAPFLHQPKNRVWTTYTFKEVDNLARKFAAGLLASGLKPGDKVSILSKNCAEWMISDLGIMMAGMVSVPIYFSAGTETISYILEHSGAKAIILGKLDAPQSAEAAITPDLTTISFSYDEAPKIGLNWDEIIANNEPLEDLIEPSDDLMSIIYTSGSTGCPKGVMISYTNAHAVGIASKALSEKPFTNNDRVVSYLPLAHIAERGLVELSSLNTGMQIYFVESLATFAEDMVHAQPTVFFSVPRIWLKIQLQILDKIPPKLFHRLITTPGIRSLLRWKIKRTLGFSKTRLFISGSAPISAQVLRWFHRVGIDISEGWAMSETCCVGTINAPFSEEDIGTIGKPMSGIDIKLSEEGEILIKGGFISPGYYKNSEATAEIMEDGWLKTGDLGKMNPSGSLSIIGRAKEQFKTTKGKYVSPVGIEARLVSHAAVEQACVTGSGLPNAIAFIVLNPGAVCDEDRLLRLLERTNKFSEGHEQLDALYVCKDTWSVENGLLTPTLKIKRALVEEKYHSVIELFKEEKLPKGIHFE